MFVIPAPEVNSLNIFGFQIYFYGIIMAFAVFCAVILVNKLANKLESDSKDIFIEYAPIIIFTGIFSARLYFCLLNKSYYFTHLLELFDIRQGGLSIHGAIIGGILSLVFVAKRCKIPVLNLLDVTVPALFLGQSIGRWGNYFNSEAYGLPVASQDWGLFIPEHQRVFEYSSYSLFHPTFLYESILDFIGFIVLLFVYKKFGKVYRGLTFSIYLMLYSIIRFFLEQIRVDSALNISSIPIAEIVSIILFIVGIIGFCVSIIKSKKRI